MEGFKEKSEKGSVPNPSDRLIFVKVQARDGHFFGQNYEQILVFVIDDSLGMGGGVGGGVWWFKTSLQKENCLWERCKKKLTIQHFRLHIHT